VLVSALRKFIPSKVRIACYIVIIATFVTVVELVMQAFAYPLFLKLGIFIPLIVVNCIVLGRAEAFASKNGVFRSLLDGLGIGLGFTLALMALAAVRELLGTGMLTIWVTPIQIFGPSYQPFKFMVEAPGAFMALGLMLCLMNLAEKK
jgi:electron transport complex protein RnfE